MRPLSIPCHGPPRLTDEMFHGISLFLFDGSAEDSSLHDDKAFGLYGHFGMASHTMDGVLARE